MKNLRNKPNRRVPIHWKCIEASFLSTAVVLIFNLREYSYNIYIPGHPWDTAVYKYQNRFMMSLLLQIRTQLQDADWKEFAEIKEKKTTKVTKLI